MELGAAIVVEVTPESLMPKHKWQWSIHPTTGDWKGTVEEWDEVITAMEWAFFDMKKQRMDALRAQAEVRKEIDQITDKDKA